MKNGSPDALAHRSFPLTLQALQQLSLTPEFSYLETSNARIISDRLRTSSGFFTPAEITAIGLIGRIYLRVIDIYSSNNPGTFSGLDLFLQDQHSKSSLNSSIKDLITHYPTVKSYYSPESISVYLIENHKDPAHRYAFFRSILLLLLAEVNPPIRQKDGIFTSSVIISSDPYSQLSESFRSYFHNRPHHIGFSMSLLDLLEEPARSHPSSLEGQLKFILNNWADFLSADHLNSILKALDHIQEETNLRPLSPGAPADPLGYYQVSSLSDISDQVRFSPDQDWMPKLVLIAKNIFVWLDQLSKKYKRSITTISQIPDEELAQLSSWGFTGLWLIGLWERSSASQKIKQFCGNPEAASSAYSLYDYTIASNLGGEAAYSNLSERARSYNMRLAADMVPNHMGVFSNWIVNYPDRFLSLDHPPFPSYTFAGPNLSEDPRIGIYLEDHYFSQDDAAVVFKRVDHQTGYEDYIYHGNDGTSMPWNDTAQLDFLNSETREAVIQTILSVAKKFPIIRFDAAMTLTKKHFQRLWFPEPGSGGAIPTRSDYGLSKAEFDKSLPIEFWQEVVDRIAEESPDTLLLAEAFWMMEGYFVRSLGMHRVYNSAFMHMLRDEENKKYHDLIIQTLEYDPQILKRYVNFMNNPDEETAIAQFGSGGKYFGICVLMATLPGLPMFGHGQIEGYKEKYGMEYRRAYYDEEPDQGFVDRHLREIFPLLRLRSVFADVLHFHPFDVISPSGETLYDVFAYSNFSKDGKALVVYHNAWKEITGKVHYTSPINNLSTSLLDALELVDQESDYILFSEHISGLNYVRSVDDLSNSGLEISLGAYDYQVFLDFKLVKDSDGLYQELSGTLKGAGVENLQYSLAEIKYKTLLASMYEVSREIINYNTITLSPQVKDQIQISGDGSNTEEKVDLLFETLSTRKLISPESKDLQKIACSAGSLNILLEAFDHLSISSTICYAITNLLSDYSAPEAELILGVFEDHIREFIQLSPGSLHQLFLLSQELKEITPTHAPDLHSFADFWFNNPAAVEFIGINDYEGSAWFHKESMEILVDFSMFYYLSVQASIIDHEDRSLYELINLTLAMRQEAQSFINKSNFQVNIFKQLVHD